MNKRELYALLFTDSFTSNLAVNPGREFIIHSMKIFGTYDLFAILFISTIAFILSSSVNYLLGRLLFNIFDAKTLLVKNKLFLNNNYISFILLLSFVPFWGKFIAVFAGLARVNFLKALLIGSISKFCYYLYLLLI